MLLTGVSISGATLADDAVCVCCAKSTSSFAEGALRHGCESLMPTTGTTQAFEVELNAATNETEFCDSISNLIQVQQIMTVSVFIGRR